MFQKPAEDNTYFESETMDTQSQDTVETVVGPSVHVEGDFASEGDIIVKGTVSGNIRTSRQLRVETGAKILASVHAGSAIISGDVQGNVTASGQVEINETARISGDIRCAVLAVAPGAKIHGKVMMEGADVEGAEKTTKKRSLGRVRAKAEDPVVEEVEE